jgi:hypothetical protein
MFKVPQDWGIEGAKRLQTGTDQTCVYTVGVSKGDISGDKGLIP